VRSTSRDGVDIESLGLRIRFLRKAKGLTLARVASATGLSTGFLSQVENGQTNISLSALYRVARALDTTAPELLAYGLSLGLVRVELQYRVAKPRGD